MGLDFYTTGTAAFVTLLLFWDFQHDRLIAAPPYCLLMH